MQTYKLQKVLSDAGLGSRRKMEELIAQGAVKVNKEVAKIGARVSEQDNIYVKGKAVKNPLQREIATKVILYNKPEGEICSMNDEGKFKRVFDAIPRLKKGRWISVGRLDVNTSGLLLFTNDGNLANKLMHPKSNIKREYAVRVLGDVLDEHILNLKKGVDLGGKQAHFDEISFLRGDGVNKWYKVSLFEGRNREVRRLWQTQNLTVSRLVRINFAGLDLPRGLKPGNYVYLDSDVIDNLYRI